MKKVFAFFIAVMFITGLTGSLSAKQTSSKEQALRTAKMHLKNAALSNNAASIKNNLLKARNILYREKRTLGGHRSEALKWIKQAMLSLNKNDLNMAKRYASKAKKQVFLGIKTVEDQKKK